MKILILGAPGVGKGTQAKMIAEKHNIPHISTGEILRTEIRSGSELGKRVKSVLDVGELVPDDLISQIVENRLKEPDCQSGFILDGFPRTIPQAEGLSGILERLGKADLKVVEIYVSDAEIMTRLLARGRGDDKEDTINNRLKVYRESTAPLIAYYQGQNKFFRINGMQKVDAVFEDVDKVLS